MSFDINAALRHTTKLQSDAADPQASVWVSANAGTGKTHVLTMRVLRLLLAGTAPERILCLTYTKAAAAEMSERVFDHLAQWVTSDDADAREGARGAAQPRRLPIDERELARTLFARAIETPGGLKVQTIHAFCERLLQRFPLEAGVPPGFSILDDATARDAAARGDRRDADARNDGQTSRSGRALTAVLPTPPTTASTSCSREALATAEAGWRTSAASTGASATTPLRKWSGFIAITSMFGTTRTARACSNEAASLHSAVAIAAAGHLPRGRGRSQTLI